MTPRTETAPDERTQDGIRSDEIRTVSFVSLGCPKNLVDSERMLGLLAQDGLSPVSAEAVEDAEHDDLSLSGSEQDASATSGRITVADAVVVNTCGFLEASKQESLGVIKDALDAKARGEVKRVVVAGCLVQRHRAKILEWAPGVDAMVGVFDRDKIVDAVRGPMADRESAESVESQAAPYWIASNALTKAESMGRDVVGLTVQGKDGKGVGYFESDDTRLRLTPRHYAYLRISEGCNQNCAFCTIPSIRGKMRSKPIDRIVTEARELLRDGAFELLLIGQDTTSFGDDLGIGMPLPRPGGGGGPAQPGRRGYVETPPQSASPTAPPPGRGSGLFSAGLPKLLKQLSDAAREEVGKAWLRLMYAYPSNFSDEIIDAFAMLVEEGNLLPYIDIPLQHASDRVLTAMRRNVSATQQTELMHKLRERVPGMAIRTTFVTGFPGETEADHEELLGFIEEVGFDAVGCFRYSKEAGTVAGRMETDPELAVPEDIKQRRHDEIMALQQRIAFEQADFLAEQFDESDPERSGCRFDVLIDTPEGEAELTGYGRGHLAQGRAPFQAPKIDAVTRVVSRERLSPGELVRCAIVGSDGYDLIARPETELTSRVSLPIV